MAVGLPDIQLRALAAYVERCRTAAPGFRWVSAENLHLTLRFIGNVREEVAAELELSLEQVTFRPFQLALSRLDVFGRGPRARVVWIGTGEGEEELRGLAARVDSACQAAGLPAEERPYNPHLTLARAAGGRPAPLPELPPAPELPAWLVNAFGLYQSRLAPAGAVYSVVRAYPSG